MEKVTINFLGTGNAIPTKEKNHTAILASFKNEIILVDCGEGTQRQLKIAGLSAHKINRILITHWHGDHILGLPGLFETLVMTGYTKKLKIYGPKGTKYFMSILLKLIPGLKLLLEIHEVSGKFIDEKDFYIEAKPMSHGVPTNAYAIVIKDKIRIDKNKIKKLRIPQSPLLGKLQQGKDIIIDNKKIKAKDVTYLEKGKKVSFILDTKMNDNSIKLAKNSDILIIESAFSSEEARKAKAKEHLTSEEAAIIAKKAKVKQLILTHISQRYEHCPEVIENEAKKIFKNVSIAKDFDKIEV